MSYGKVMMLQGPSSAGKSTLATALQMSLDEYWWALEADDISNRMMPTGGRTNWWNPTGEERPHPSWDQDMRLKQWLAIYWNCIATIAKTGSNVIAVGGWLETEWLLDLAAALEGIEAYCVGVYCPLEETERREIARGDRKPGYSRSLYDRVHTHAPYDGEVDTVAQTTDESINAIKKMLHEPPQTLFFERIRRSHSQ